MEKETPLTEKKLLTILPESATDALNATELCKLILGSNKWEQGLKSNVNKLLYAMEKERLVAKIDGTPPRWFKQIIRVNVEENVHSPKITSKKSKSQEWTYVYIDVDNSPCLKEAMPYAKGKTILVSYASPAYNHYIPEVSENVIFKRLSANMNDQKNAADVLFCMHMSKTCIEKSGDKLTFLIVSKDKLLLTCGKMHAENFGIEYIPLTDGWNDLKMYLE